MNQYSEKTLSLSLFLAAALWGLYWWPLRQIEQLGVTDVWSVALFNACPLVLLVPYVIWNRKTQLAHLPHSLLVALCIGLALTCYASGLVLSNVVRTTMLFYLTSIWSTMIGVAWLSEKITASRIGAIILGLIGLVLLLSGNGEGSQPLNFGDFLALLSGIFWAFGAACLNRWPQVPLAGSVMFQFIATTIFSTALGFVLFGASLPTLSAVTAAFPIALIASNLVLLPSILVLFAVSKLLFPGRVGILMMSEVIVAVLSATLLLPDETMSTIQWMGGASIVAACLFEVLGGMRVKEVNNTG